MKKSLKVLTFILGLACVAGLAGCRGGGGGDALTAAEEAEAINKVKGNLAQVNNTTPLLPGEKTDLVSDTNDNVAVIVKRNVKVNNKAAEVTVEWTYDDSTTQCVSSFHDLEGNDGIKVFEFYYPESEAGAKEFSFTGTPKCGTTTGDAVSFTVSLQPMNLVFPEYTLAQILAVKSDGSCFEHVTDAENGYWESNNLAAGVKQMYITTFGKVVYLAPDGNWGLIADGDHYFEIYAGSGTALNSKNYPNLVVGNKVAIRGRMSDYNGNVQLSFISKVELTDKDIAEPATYKTLDEAGITGWNQFDGKQNALYTVTGTYHGNLKDKEGNAVTPATLPNNRYTFELTVGSKTLVIAMDYHTWNKKADNELYVEWKNIITSAVADSTTFTIKGTMRYVMSGTGHFKNVGAYQLTPYLTGDVAAA